MESLLLWNCLQLLLFSILVKVWNLVMNYQDLKLSNSEVSKLFSLKLAKAFILRVIQLKEKLFITCYSYKCEMYRNPLLLLLLMVDFGFACGYCSQKSMFSIRITLDIRIQEKFIQHLNLFDIVDSEELSFIINSRYWNYSNVFHDNYVGKLVREIKIIIC